MNNGANTWGVSFSKIDWFNRLLTQHDNVANVRRSDDIVFTFDRAASKDTLRALCCDEYTMSFTSVQRAVAEFGALDLLYIGGGWNGYTSEAKEYCLNQHIGLFVSNEMSGALWKHDHWTYHQRDKDGNPIYYYRAA